MSRSAASNREVTLEEVLSNRDARVQRQRDMMSAHPGGIVSITVNMPGPVKDTADTRSVLQAAVKAVLAASVRGGWLVNFQQILHLPTGPEALLSTNLAPLSLKKTMIAIEEAHPLGRLFDLDVLDEDGRPLSRSAFGAPERACLLCDRPARECARYRSHGMEELRNAFVALAGDFAPEHCAAPPGGKDFSASRAGTAEREKTDAPEKTAKTAREPGGRTPPRRKRRGCMGCLAGCLVRLLVFCLLAHAALAGAVAYWGWEAGKGMIYSKVVVVLGSETYRDGTPSPRLAARLDKAVERYRMVPCTIIVSGGTDASGVNEAEAMARYLRNKGVDPQHVVVDPHGVNTWATAQFTRDYLRSRNETRVVAVSQYFHLLRCLVALRLAGVDTVGVTAPDYAEWRDVYSAAREVPALFFYLKEHATPETLARILSL